MTVPADGPLIVVPAVAVVLGVALAVAVAVVLGVELATVTLLTVCLFVACLLVVVVVAGVVVAVVAELVGVLDALRVDVGPGGSIGYFTVGSAEECGSMAVVAASLRL